MLIAALKNDLLSFPVCRSLMHLVADLDIVDIDKDVFRV